MESILMFLKDNKDAFSSFGTIVALSLFLFAFYQYRRAESWKKSEFIAKLYKDFIDDADCQRAMWMLDWRDRPINFGSEEKPIVKDYTWDILFAALRKHDKKPFSDLEMRIRDTFDRFFSFIEQFERAMQNNLVRKEQVYPYFAYWIELLAGKRHLSDPYRSRVLEYIDEYGFNDVKRFLDRWPK
jgi:hypothetical protein